MIKICPTPQKLKSLSLGQLPEEQSDELLRHLGDCESCQQEIGQLDDVEDSLVQQLKLAGTPQPNDFARENGCRSAVTRALAALASVENKIVDNDAPNVPQSIGEYEIIKPLGTGGMGHVYLGEHTKLNRPVAIKLIADHRRWDKSMHHRFESEMRLIGGLKHNNIVAAHDAREVDGLAVLVTEYIDGLTVSEILKRKVKLTVADACMIVSEICQALDYIDSKGFVHRDIKPSNIMIDIDGKVKLLDLGLAKLQSDDSEAGEFTATGQAIGTADYVAPEQINDARNVDIRADIYGLGCTFYKLLSGQAPFARHHSTAFAKMNAHVSERPASLSSFAEHNEIPTELVQIVERMLEKNPELRPQSPSDVCECVDQFTHGSDLARLVSESRFLPAQSTTVHATAVNSPKTDGDFSRKFPWIAVIAGGLAAFLLGIWLGITITVKKSDGTSATVEIPDGSTAIVDADGNIEIRLAGSDQKVHLPGANVTVAPRNIARNEPAKRGTSSIHRSGIERTASGLDVQYVLAPDSPLFDKVESGDLIDVFSSFLRGNDTSGLRTRRLIASKIPVKRTEGTNAIRFKITNNDAELAADFSEFARRLAVGHRINAEPYLEFEFHDPENQLIEDSIRFSGVWRVEFGLVDGKIVEPDASGQVMLFFRNQLIQPKGERVTKDAYVLKSEPDQNVIQIGNQDQHYRFLSNRRLELYWDPQQPDAVGTTEKEYAYAMRLERVIKPKTADEKAAFEIIELVNLTKSKFECYLARDSQNRYPASNVFKIPGSEKQILLLGEPIITNQDVLSAKTSEPDGRIELEIQLTMGAGQRMRSATKASIGKRLAILVDGKLITVPVIESTIHRGLRISGIPTRQEAERIADSIVPEFPEGVPTSNDANRGRSQANLKQIMLALHQYQVANGHFPTSMLFDRGKHPYSWRVALLPSLGHGELYQQYNFDEPWDSKANSKVRSQMPDVFRHPSFPSDSTTTNYVGIAGADAAFGIEKPHSFADIRDGSSNTVFLIESKADIPWTKPEDFPLDSLSKPLPNLYQTLMKFVYLDEAGLGVAFGDGEPAFLDPAKLTPDFTTQDPIELFVPKTLKLLFQINDGTSFDKDSLPLDPAPPKLFREKQ